MDEYYVLGQSHVHTYTFLKIEYTPAGFMRHEQCPCGNIRMCDLTEDDRRIMNEVVHDSTRSGEFRG